MACGPLHSRRTRGRRPGAVRHATRRKAYGWNQRFRDSVLGVYITIRRWAWTGRQPSVGFLPAVFCFLVFVFATIGRGALRCLRSCVLIYYLHAHRRTGDSQRLTPSSPSWCAPGSRSWHSSGAGERGYPGREGSPTTSTMIGSSR